MNFLGKNIILRVLTHNNMCKYDESNKRMYKYTRLTRKSYQNSQDQLGEF